MVSSVASHLESLLGPQRKQLATSVIPQFLDAFTKVAKILREELDVGKAGTENAFGDAQLSLDIETDDAISQALAGALSIVTYSSEEGPVEGPVKRGDNVTTSTDERYTVAYDPLDGSSIIDANWSVGTIVGIWDGDSAIGQLPSKKQIASILGVYGPRTTAIIAIRDLPHIQPLCIEVGLDQKNGSQWKILREAVHYAQPPFKTRYFSPANLRSAAESPKYMSLISSFITDKWTLRYIGGLVPDIVHALVKGHGLYVNPVTATNKAKLRRLYELCPIALIVECAGGKAVNPATGKDILETPLGDCDERSGLICGNSAEVNMAVKLLLD